MRKRGNELEVGDVVKDQFIVIDKLKEDPLYHKPMISVINIEGGCPFECKQDPNGQYYETMDDDEAKARVISDTAHAFIWERDSIIASIKALKNLLG